MSAVGEVVKYDLYPDSALAFSDDFTGASIDQAKWVHEYRWGPAIRINKEVQYYPTLGNPLLAEVIEFEGTHINLVAKTTPPESQSLAVNADDDGNYNAPLISAVLSTADKFSIMHCRAECEMYFPGTAGTNESDGAFPAFWGQAYFPRTEEGGYGFGGYPVLPELDIGEILGNFMQEIHFSTHADPSKQRNLITSSTRYVTPADLRGGWHKVGVEWGYESCRFYLGDTFVVDKLTPKSWVYPFFFNLNLAVADGGTAFGSKIERSVDTVLPMKLGLRNMKVWPLMGTKVYPIPGGFGTQLKTTARGDRIITRKTSVVKETTRPIITQQQELYVPYLNTSSEEVEYTGDASVLSASLAGDVGTPKTVVWSCREKPNCKIVAHRHMRISIQDFDPGGEYTLVISRVQHLVNPEIFHAQNDTVKEPKGTYDVSPGSADDAYIKTVYKFIADGQFLLTESVAHY